MSQSPRSVTATPSQQLPCSSVQSAAFAGPLTNISIGTSTSINTRQSLSSLPFLRVTCKQALQAHLWNHEAMITFVNAVLGKGFALLIPHGPYTAHGIESWFGDMALSCHPAQHEHAENGWGAWRLACPVEGQRRLPHQNHADLLCGLAAADFVSAANEHWTDAEHYVRKVLSWVAPSRCTIVETHTGIEYFAEFRIGIWMMISIGVQSASDRGQTTLRQFVYEGHDVNIGSLHDHTGFADVNIMDELRRFLHDAICTLAGPNMSLVHDICFEESSGGARYAKVELCRNVQGCVEEDEDLSYISRSEPGFMMVSGCNTRVAAEAMRTVFDDTHEQHMRDLFENDSVPIAVYKAYDVAKAVRVVPNRFAVNRRRYAGILSERRCFVVPTAETAMHRDVKPTQKIRTVNMEQLPVNHEWLALIGLMLLSAVSASAVAYAVSRDSRVTSADIPTVVVTVLVVLMISLPQLYVTIIGGGYTIGEFYRGCMPMAACLRKHGVGFLRECVSRGVDVEKFVSGRYACFLMLGARGSVAVGPVRIRDLDNRWDYGINEKGELCMRYRSKVGVLQLREKTCQESGRLLRWWHCAVSGDCKITKEVSRRDVLKELGDGEVG